MVMRRLAAGLMASGVVLLATACGDAGPKSGPGTLTASVLSPNGAEGSAVVELFGPGMGEVGALEGRVFSEQRGDTIRVVLIRDDDGGDLRFTVAVADTTQPFTGTVLEVAGPDDALRAAVSAYSLEVRR